MLFNKLLTAIVAVLLLATVNVAAEPGGGPIGGPFARELFMAEKLASELELNDAQRSDVQRLMDQTRDQARPYVREMMEQRKAMHTLMVGETFDEAALRAQAAKGGAIMTELMVIRARSEVEVRKLLTPQQREKMEKMRKRHHHKHRGD